MKVLFIFPHPDDETIFAGGKIAKHIAQGDEVIWLCASYGERGGIFKKRSSRLFYFAYLFLGYFPFLIYFQRIVIWWLSIFRKPDQEVIETRKNEAEKVARTYGISKLHFLGIEDMRFGKNTAKLENEIRKFIELYQPQLVYTFHPNGVTDHPDHRHLTRSIMRVFKSFLTDKKPKLFGATILTEIVKKYKLPLFGAREITNEVELNQIELEKKLQAIGAYKSQKYLWEIFLQKYPELLKKEYFVRLDLKSEILDRFSPFCLY